MTHDIPDGEMFMSDEERTLFNLKMELALTSDGDPYTPPRLTNTTHIPISNDELQDIMFMDLPQWRPNTGE